MASAWIEAKKASEFEQRLVLVEKAMDLAPRNGTTVVGGLPTLPGTNIVMPGDSPTHCWTKWKGTTARRYRLATMLVLDALFDHIQQISSNVEIIRGLVQVLAHPRYRALAGAYR
jgi:hypothetical protein